MKTPSIEGLRSTLKVVDNMSQDAFSRIKAMCSVTLLAMEQHGRPIDMEDVAQVLKQIYQASDEAENCINSEAEGFGCNYKDAQWHRRLDAYQSWRSDVKVEG